MGQAYQDGIIVNHYNNVLDNLGSTGQWAWFHGTVAANADVQDGIFTGTWGATPQRNHIVFEALPSSAFHAKPAWTATGQLTAVWFGSRHIHVAFRQKNQWHITLWSAFPAALRTSHLIQASWNGSALELLTHSFHTTALWTVAQHHPLHVVFRQPANVKAWVQGQQWAILLSPSRLALSTAGHVHIDRIQNLPPIPPYQDTLACTPSSHCLVGVTDPVVSWDSAAPPNGLWELTPAPSS
jgi:hypothetical protein